MPASLALGAVSNAGAPTPISRSLELESRVLRTIAELEALEPQWRALWLAGESTPFQSPDWLIPFARYFAPEHLRVLTIHRNHGLVAIAPFYLWNNAPASRQLLLLGSGIADYLDLLVRRDLEADGLQEIPNFLRESHSEWRRCDLTQLPPNSPLLNLAASCRATPCPQLDLTDKSETNYAPAHRSEE